MSTPPDAQQLAALLRPTSVRTGPLWSLAGVWFRHYRVYTRTLLANAAPPVLEPLFFFTAVAIGLGGYIRDDGFGGLGYRAYVASGLAVTSAMFTATFETTYGTFVRLAFQRTYDAMLGTHLRVGEMFVGELLFAATKGLVFSAVVVLVTMLFGVRPSAWGMLVPLVGCATAYLFGALGLIVTSYVKMINNYSFYTSGVITPMFFFSGTFFPILGLHPAIDAIAWLLPLSHPIEMSRALYAGTFTWTTLLHGVILGVWLAAAHVVALTRMQRRVVR
jgi:lipooligosaccharide transport system permease protein